MCGCYYILFIWTHCYWPSARQHEELTTFFLCLLLWLKIGRGWKGDKREREVIQQKQKRKKKGKGKKMQKGKEKEKERKKEKSRADNTQTVIWPSIHPSSIYSFVHFANIFSMSTMPVLWG